MELRVLEYFLAVAREQNITRAAEYLHLTQPTLSRQLSDLENELGKKLLVRGKRKVTLTEEGMFFRRRAEEIVSLAQRTKAEMSGADDNVAGDVYIGAGESLSIRNIMKICRSIQLEYPDIRFHFTSGDSADLVDKLEKGLFDFCILFGDMDRSKYEYLSLPYTERWGVLMKQGDVLCSKDKIYPEDLWDKPLILSRHSLDSPRFFKWLGKKQDELNITCTYNLIYNGALMAEEDMGYVMTLDGLVNTAGTDLCFRPVYPVQTIDISIAWKKHKMMSNAAEKFIKKAEKIFLNF